MAMPTDIGVIDTLMMLPFTDRKYWVEKWNGVLRDEDSKTGAFKHPAGYMYKETVDIETDDPIRYTLGEMDKYGITSAVLSVKDDVTAEAVTRHPDRFLASVQIDPNKGMDEVRKLADYHERFAIVSASFFPSGCIPQVPINDKKVYPIYAKCVELGIPIFVNAGIPGPRFPMEAQYVGHADEVCWFFPELTMIFRHGCTPWTELAVQLLLKWPNLYYSTSAFAPKYYPKDVIDFANTRGADKIIYAGYFPSGLSLERSFTELRDVPFRDHVWPKFLRDNARRVLKLDQRRVPVPAPAHAE